MAVKLRIRRGLKKDLPTLAVGELAYCTDTNELFIGDTEGNTLVNDKRILTGVTSGIPALLAGDMYYDVDTLSLYIGTSTGNVLVNPQREIATQQEAEAGDNSSKVMTPERTKQAILELAPETDLSEIIEELGNKVDIEDKNKFVSTSENRFEVGGEDMDLAANPIIINMESIEYAGIHNPYGYYSDNTIIIGNVIYGLTRAEIYNPPILSYHATNKGYVDSSIEEALGNVEDALEEILGV